VDVGILTDQAANSWCEKLGDAREALERKEGRETKHYHTCKYKKSHLLTANNI